MLLYVRALFFLCLGVVASQANADAVLNSEFAFQMDNSVFLAPEFQFTEKLQGEEKLQLPDTVVEDLAPVKVSGIEANVRYKMNAGSKQIILGAEHIFASQELEARIGIREISINSVIEKVINGVKVRVRIQGSCSNVALQLVKGSAKVMGSLRTGLDKTGLPDIKVPWFDVSWTDGAWRIEDFSCTGVDGLKDRVIVGLKNYLRDPSPFMAEMKKAVNEKVAAYEADVRTWFANPRPISMDVQGLRVTMYPKSIQNSATGRFFIKGILEFAFASRQVNRTIEVRGTTTPGEVSSFSLFLPEGLPQALSDLAWEAGFFNHSEKGMDLAPFRKIREELINEVYVWPELQLYPKNADFLFDFSVASRPRLSALGAEADGTPVGRVESAVQVQSWAPRLQGPSGHDRFVRFDTPLNGRYRLKILNSELRTVFTDLMMKLAHTWDSEYKKKLRFEKVDTDMMQSEAEKSLKSEGYAIALGKLPLTSLMTLAPTSVRFENGWLRIDWK